MTRDPGAIVAGVIDNAMLYKDMTQWLRNRTFLILFFGLLAVAEVTIALMVLLPGSEENIGAFAFNVLSGILFLYAVIIAFLGHNLTAREFFNRTFELYELSGMSLERMVWGKLLSMLTQFLFGFFCLTPFMFVSFMLGGLDFYLVVTVSVLLIVAVLPLYLFALLVALLSRSRQVSGVIRGLIVVFFFLFFPWWGGLFFYFQMVGMSGGTSPVEFFKLLLTLDVETIQSALIFLAFYAQVCLLLFYTCCNAISPSTDSRWTAIHFVSFLLSLSYLALMVSHARSGVLDAEAGYAYYVPLMILFLLIGVGSYYNRLDIPVMVLNRRRRARFPGTRVVNFLFHPGARGAFTTLLLLYLLLGLSWGFARYEAILPREFHEAAAAALQTPFFLALPGAVLLLNRNLASRMATLRIMIIAWWIVLGIPLMITAMMLRYEPYSFETGSAIFLRTLALVLSPLSSIFVDVEGFELLRVMLGIIGVIVLARVLAFRRKREAGGAKRKAAT